MTLEIIFWDVQHGNATYIKTPNGTHIVQDLGIGSYGTNRKEFSPLLHLRRKYGIDRLDYLIITHPHKDHIADIMNLNRLNPFALRRPKHLSKDDILRNVRQEDKYLFERYFEINQKYSVKIPPNENPRFSENNGGVDIQVFSPKSCNTANLNNHSIVTVLSYARSKVILSGDNEPPSWKELLKEEDFRNAICDADILLAPHHGRDSGYSVELFEHFRPKLIIVSDGRFCDTSATDRYYQKSTGWTVHHRSGRKETRHCVTTRNDGVIVVNIGKNPNNKSFIEVTID